MIDLKNKLHLLGIVNVIVLVVILGLGVFMYCQQASQRIVTVDEQLLFKKFQMKLDMKRIGLLEVQTKQKNIYDLHNQLQVEGLQEEVKNRLMQELIGKREELDQFNQQFSMEETRKIWQRISSYTKEFSEKKNISYLVGTSNKQTILYTTPTSDVTNELLVFINKRYEGN